MNLSSETHADRWVNIAKAAVWKFDNHCRYLHLLTYFNSNFVYSTLDAIQSKRTPLDFLFNTQLEELY